MARAGPERAQVPFRARPSPPDPPRAPSYHGNKERGRGDVDWNVAEQGPSRDEQGQEGPRLLIRC